MRASWLRLAVWLVLTFTVVTTGFLGTIYFLATPAFRQELAADGATNWGLRMSCLYGLCLVSAIVFVVWLVVRRTFVPIVSLNDQLSSIDPANLQSRIQIRSDDIELRELQEHINGLLSRISLSLHQLQGYSAQVAHELRGPLTIIRLKIEAAADKIEPALAEEIQTELLRLTMHVEQALLVARAEQGFVRPNPIRFDLAGMLEDVAEDFRLLARDQGRQIDVQSEKSEVSADPKYLKQILYSLLTNSLRHGRGTIYATVRSESGATVLSIKNQIRVEESDETLDLGLGRRIVAALTALHENMEIKTDRKDGWYKVALVILDSATTKTGGTQGHGVWQSIDS